MRIPLLDEVEKSRSGVALRGERRSQAHARCLTWMTPSNVSAYLRLDIAKIMEWHEYMTVLTS